MPSLLVIVFFVQLAIYIVNTVGASAINELAWLLYSKLPTPYSASIAKARAQRQELIRLKTEIKSFSAQDEFARWAKLSRQYEKLEKEYNKDATALNSHKTRFESTVSSARWTATNGLRLFLIFWYAKTPMFWLPKGLMPRLLERLLAFPRAPTGSISIQVWGMACASVIAMVGEVVQAILVLLRGSAPAQPVVEEVGTGQKSQKKAQ